MNCRQWNKAYFSNLLCPSNFTPRGREGRTTKPPPQPAKNGWPKFLQRVFCFQFTADTVTQFDKSFGLFQIFASWVASHPSDSQGITRRFTLKCTCLALAGVAQWIEHWPVTQGVTSSIPSSGMCLVCGPGPQWGRGGWWEAKTHWCISPSLPLSVKIFKK